MRVKVTDKELTTSPVSLCLCSNFIELGYGNQVEPMRAEMLFNRSFERFAPYNSGTHDWYGLFIDHRNPSLGYKNDWSQEDWYHSGYEHNPWFAAPGSEGPLTIDSTSTFLVPSSPLADVSIGIVDMPVRHGNHALRIANNELDRWGGVAQAGKQLTAGEAYRFRGWARSEEAPCPVEMRFYADAADIDWDAPIAIIPLGNAGTEWTQFTAEFNNDTFEGRAVFCIWTPPRSRLILDDFSLMPASAIDGWRRDVVGAVRRINPQVIRFPGGCFASFYDWRDGVGPISDRRPEPSCFWGGMNENDTGTAEFAALCRAGSEMLFCINMFHPKKDSYLTFRDEKGEKQFWDTRRFTDHETGLKLACDWVAYCNLPAGSHPMADLRAEHGHPEPFGVKYWEMDNETARWFEPVEYAHAIVEYSSAMKSVDPGIEIGMMIYDNKYLACLSEMLHVCGPYIDFVADRGGGEERLNTVLSVLRRSQKEMGPTRTPIRYCNTEWLPDDFNSDVFQSLAADPAPRTYNFNKWRYALNMFPCLMTWQRYGDEIGFINFNNLANTHGQSALETPKEGAFLTGAGMVLELLSRSPAAWPLALDGYIPGDLADFQIQAAWDLDRNRLVLYVLNLTPKESTAEFDLQGIGGVFRIAEETMLTASGPLTHNTTANHNAVQRIDRVRSSEGSDCLCVNVPPYTFVQTVLS